MEIDEDERDRKSDIYLDYAKTYVYNKDFEIPEGYTLKVVEKLNIYVDNTMGSFTTTAAVENGFLRLKTIKT